MKHPPLRSTTILSALLPVLLAGCVSVPPLPPKPAPAPISDFAAQQTLGAATAADAQWPAQDWWHAYGDPQLDALIAEGLQGAPDVAAAVARLHQAQGYAQQQRAPLLPKIDGRIIGQETYAKDFPGGLLSDGWSGVGADVLQLSFDLDLWGKNRAALRAAKLESTAAELDVAQARLTLSTAIASSYADLARLYAERDVQDASIRLKETQAQLTSDRVTNGLDTQAELKQAQAAVPAAREQLLQIDENIALTRNALAALLGKGPDRGLSIARPTVQIAARGLPAGVTTDLIAHRPDVAAALARVKADDEQIKVARAGFYPAVSISALAAHPAIGLENLVQGSTLLGGVGPSISMPIFHAGEIKGKYRSARSTFDEAVATYDKTVATAFHDVADAAASQLMLTRRLDQSQQALTQSEAAYDVARMRYEGGLSTYLNVLSAQEAVLTARRTHADLQARAFTLDVALVRALGGGLSASVANNTPSAAPTANAPKDATHG
ncbi:efflux transporter outer membrane subunit [Novosphingobium rosa]|uniref:efflux transporter outer membrane subunit n=1 Tax=Novosphingobium rosa TaxID=76978 RepID=UPI00082CFB09|nr:efflux transporter outer membrane subunit [Novosphingobium rosa]